MDELTLLRRLEADTAAPSRAAVTRAFDALHEEMTAAERRHVATSRRRRPRRLRWALLATAAAAAAVVALVVTDSIGVAGLRGGASAQAAELLRRAADTTIRSVDPTMTSGQFRQVVRRSVHAMETGGPSGATVLYSIHEDRTTWIPADLREEWTEVRFPIRSAGQYWGDGAEQVAVGEDARTRGRRPQVLRARGGAFFGDPDPRVEAVRSLPRDPRVLLNRIYRVTAGTGSSPDDEALVFIADTLDTGYADASLRAALYRAAALVPGVTLTADSATLGGRTGVAIGRVEPKYGIRQDLIIDPDTGTLIGQRRVATRALDGLIPAATTIAWSSETTTVVNAVPAEYRR